MSKKVLFMTAILMASIFSAIAAVSAQTALPAQAGQPIRMGNVYENNHPYPYGNPYSPQPYYNNRGRRGVSFREYYGFDGIPFNGSHIQAFRRFHGRGF